MKGKIIIVSAPSGTGKSTIISRLMKIDNLRLCFSISATSRSPRQGEMNGREYYFITDEEFIKRVENEEFIEFEEVYPGTHYGTLKSEVDRISNLGCNLIMDIDVKGGVNVKKQYGDRALAIFIEPPSLEALERRLRGRATDSEETIRKRLDKAGYELSFAPNFDTVIVNDDLETATAEVRKAIENFIAEKQ